MRRSNIFETVTTRGALLPTDFLAKLSQKPGEVKHTKPGHYNHSGEKLNEVISRAWNTLNINWKHFSEQEEKSTAVTRDRWLIPLFRELDYGNLKKAQKQTIDEKDYPISHTRDNVPIHLLGTDISLDHRTAGKTRQIPHSMMQEYLNKPETPIWGILTNGYKLRILRENSSMTRQAYIEFDLEKMMESQAFSDFTLLYLICHESRFTKQTKDNRQIIEEWATQARKEGIRALSTLTNNVTEAINSLGRGFLINHSIREKLTEEGYKQEYYRQLLRTVYRMIFMLTAESRELLLNPEATQEAKDCYYRYYSITRIRTLAEKKRGTRHKDLWKALSVTIKKLCADTETEELGLLPLGSFLWSEAATADLNDAEIENRHLLEAVRAITQIKKEGVTTRIDYRNLGSEELGSIYESLLEMKPHINADARHFNLKTEAGNERKETGSYYTPTELITELLNSALDPVMKTKKTEQEILNTKVCDPACGSGHFLIAAAHRMARHLAAVRTEEEEPDPNTYRTALRDIISHCIYGVDINPMSVELCKISLWLEAIEPGKPLSFLDHHIKCGNSLMGTDQKLMTDAEVSSSQGTYISIPDNAFNPITGDDKKTAAALKKRNKKERQEISQDLFKSLQPEDDTVKRIAYMVAELDHTEQHNINQLKQKEATYHSITESHQFNTERTKANLWCAAFVQNKTAQNQTPITTKTLRNFSETKKLPEEQQKQVTRLAEQYQFFHWYLEFPEVFRRESEEKNGFDVVLGNPPWERIKLQEKEFFAGRDETVANASNASTRRKKIDLLKESDPTLYKAFQGAKRISEGNSLFLRSSQKFPLCGRGDVNTYTVFAELNKNLINSHGRVGCIVPSGIATDDTTKFYFQHIMEENRLVSLYEFENDGFFEGAGSGHMVRFALVTLTAKNVWKKDAQFLFQGHQIDDLKDSEKRFTLSSEDIALINPNTKTCPIFKTKRDAKITKSIYRRVPVLINENDEENGNPWGIRFMRMFDMSNDSNLFKTKEQLESEGWELEGNVFKKCVEKYLPLYEAKMIYHYNHRYGDFADAPEGKRAHVLPDVPVERLKDPNYFVLPYYWVPESEVRERLSDSHFTEPVLLGFRNVTDSRASARSVIASLLPMCGVGNSLPLICNNGEYQYFLYANLVSFALDFIARQKISGLNLNFHFVKQFPIIPIQSYDAAISFSSESRPISEWLKQRVLKLVYSTSDMKPFALSCGYSGDPLQWNEEELFKQRCELDAVFFHLYGISQDDVEYIMETFPIVKRSDEAQWGSYRTKDGIIKAYKQIIFLG